MRATIEMLEGTPTLTLAPDNNSEEVALKLLHEQANLENTQWYSVFEVTDGDDFGELELSTGEKM